VVVGTAIVAWAVVCVCFLIIDHPKVGVVQGVEIAVVFLIFLSIGLVADIGQYTVAVRYERAEADFRRRREEVKAKHRSNGDDQPG
jgi:hypothetical protein